MSARLNHLRRRVAFTAAGVACVLTGTLLSVAPAQAAFGLSSFTGALENQADSADFQAGSHPYRFTTKLAFNATGSRLGEKGVADPDADPRDVHVALPPGLIGNPTPVPRCSEAAFTALKLGGAPSCPPSAQIGSARVFIYVQGLGKATYPAQAIYNLVPPPGSPARFGFVVSDYPVMLTPHLRSPGDYGITVDSLNTTQAAPIYEVETTFWGVPADFNPEASPFPFLTLPTSCAGPLTTTIQMDSWQQPAAYLPDGEPDLADPNWVGSEFSTPALGGCENVPFAPTAAALPTTDHATSASGLGFDLDFKNEGLLNPEGLAESNVKKAVVTLPEGFTVNPSAGSGLGACTMAEYEAENLHSQPSEGCPESSKLGTVEVESPLAEGKIEGDLYIAKQTENPFHSLLAMYMVARNTQLGVFVEAAGKVQADPVTGQLTTTFDNLPQLPFSHFHLAFHQGQTSPLISPPACGTYAAKAALYPYSEPALPRIEESSFQITAGPEGLGCPSGGVPPFHPELLAGTQNNNAGSYSPFYVRISRHDSEQEITHFSIKLPPGVSGKLAGVPECSDAQVAAAKAREREGGGAEELANPSCPQASEVGHSLVEAGVGSVLAQAPGKMYLAGPYHGSNLSLVSITAAEVGPFDLGTVVVRFALKIDPETAEVSVDGQGSDPIPHIVDGIPTHLRTIRAYVDRPSFTLNPTNCARTSTASTVLGSGLDFASEADDQPFTVTSPFQAADCASLGFAPKLALSLKGGTHRGATPAFKAVLTYPKGSYANVKTAQVTLPSSEYLEQAHIGTVCTRVQFAQGAVPGEKCPAASVYGKAKAVTPILSEPLEGPVYLRSSSHPLPDLVAALHNNQVNIDLDGQIDAVHKKGSEVSRIRNTFEAVPDAPVSSFTLEMQGGNKGLLTNSTNICKGTHLATAALTGQNGKVYDTNPVLRAQCGKKGKQGKSAASRRLGTSHR